MLFFFASNLVYFALTFLRPFYLNPEISLYPYFVSHHLLPYSNIIDQHFPLIFFGPLNLSQIGITQPHQSLFLYLAILFFTNLFAYFTLKRRQLSHQKIIYLCFLCFSLFLGSSNFWIENFLLLFLCLSAFLFTYKHSLAQFLAALSLSLIIGVKPTLTPFILLFLLYFSSKKLLSFFTLLIFPLIELLWLLNYHLLESFYQLFLFNFHYYSPLASKLPSLRQISFLGFFGLPLIILLFSTISPLNLLLLLITASAAAFPRFELNHLLPLSIIFLFPFISSAKKHFPKLLLLILFLNFLLLVYKAYPFQPQNYHQSPQLTQLKSNLPQFITKSSTLFVLGGPDSLYQLTNTLPPDNFYLPSLPWYYANPDWQDRQIRALKNNPTTPVILNPQASVDGVSLLDYASPVVTYIYQNYTQVAIINHYQIYLNQHQIIAKQ